MMEMHMVKTFIAVFSAAIAVAGALTVIAVYSAQRDSRQKDINHAVCTAVVRLDGAVTETLRRSLKNLPKIAYYKEHPDELAAQEANIRLTLKEFIPPIECVHNAQEGK